MSGSAYVGNELELFKEATNWKRYWADNISPFVTGSVLEVGAGLGASTRALCTGKQASWTALEPDASMAAQLADDMAADPLPVPVEVICGTLNAVLGRKFSCVLYIDVLEHVEDDKQELLMAAKVLAPGGHLVVLSPAHQWLFSRFDHRIGHYRRYSRETLNMRVPRNLTVCMLRYLDAAGVMASLANKLLLRQATPSVQQVRFWDRFLVPLSRQVDNKIAFSFGKSILGVWRSQ